MYQIYFIGVTLYMFRTSELGGQSIRTVKYVGVYELVIMAKAETVLEDMTDRLVELRGCYGIDMDVEKSRVMRISREPPPTPI